MILNSSNKENMKKKYTHEEYKEAIKKYIPDITVEHIESQPGNEYSAIVYSFPEGRKVQIAGTKLNNLDIKDNVAGILSIRNGSHN